MSAEHIYESIKELPIWIIHGSNWTCEVPLDEYNAQFDEEAQAYEAASQALMAFKGQNDKLSIVIDDGEDVPYLGIIMIAALKGPESKIDGIKSNEQSQLENSRFLPTHIVLANQGFYQESVEMQKLYTRDSK